MMTRVCDSLSECLMPVAPWAGGDHWPAVSRQRINDPDPGDHLQDCYKLFSPDKIEYIYN